MGSLVNTDAISVRRIIESTYLYRIYTYSIMRPGANPRWPAILWRWEILGKVRRLLAMGVPPCRRNQCPMHVPDLWLVQHLEIRHLSQSSAEDYKLVIPTIIYRRVGQVWLDGERFERSKAPFPRFHNTMGWVCWVFHNTIRWCQRNFMLWPLEYSWNIVGIFQLHSDYIPTVFQRPQQSIALVSYIYMHLVVPTSYIKFERNCKWSTKLTNPKLNYSSA